MVRVLMAESDHAGEFRGAADRDEHCKSACRVAERANARRVDVVVAGPGGQQVVDREADVAGPLEEVARGEAVGVVAPLSPVWVTAAAMKPASARANAVS